METVDGAAASLEGPLGKGRGVEQGWIEARREVAGGAWHDALVLEAESEALAEEVLGAILILVVAEQCLAVFDLDNAFRASMSLDPRGQGLADRRKVTRIEAFTTVIVVEVRRAWDQVRDHGSPVLCERAGLFESCRYTLCA